MAYHHETVCKHRPGSNGSVLGYGAGLLLAVLILWPGHAMAGSVTMSFSGHVPARNLHREGQGGDAVVVGFASRVLLPVPEVAANLKSGEIRLQAVDVQGEGAVHRLSWRGDAGEAPPVFLEVPLLAGGETRYRVCVHSASALKKQCRAYRIVPAPGMKP